MTFISYAQNYEDVMLRRALKNVEIGVYIDVGANDPLVDSVTKAFYDIGWRGLNLEPVTEWFDKLQNDRPEDSNLQLAVGEKEGSLEFYEIVGTGLSTMDVAIAEKHGKELEAEIKKYEVPVEKLSNICKKYAFSEIHFLKIDVEGAELSVLKGFDLKIYRPWIILIESTLPNSQLQRYDDWEPLLISGDYHYVYFDGLNRYYVANEHMELDIAFQSPPNVFDDFKRSSEDWFEQNAKWLKGEQDKSEIVIRSLEETAQDAEDRAQKAIVKAKKLEDKVKSFKVKIKDFQGKIIEVNKELQLAEDWALKANAIAIQSDVKAQMAREEAQSASLRAEIALNELQIIYRSVTWKVMRPLRKGLNVCWRIIRLPKRVFRKIVVITLRVSLSRPKFRKKIVAWLNEPYRVNKKLLLMANSRNMIPIQPLVISQELSSLSPVALRVYAKLKADIESQGTETR